MSDDQKIEFIDVRMRAARMEIETLRRERDEARREVCKAESCGRIGRFGTAQEHAKRMGWDCFKEAK